MMSKRMHRRPTCEAWENPALLWIQLLKLVQRAIEVNQVHALPRQHANHFAQFPFESDCFSNH